MYKKFKIKIIKFGADIIQILITKKCKIIYNYKDMIFGNIVVKIMYKELKEPMVKIMKYAWVYLMNKYIQNQKYILMLMFFIKLKLYKIKYHNNRVMVILLLVMNKRLQELQYK